MIADSDSHSDSRILIVIVIVIVIVCVTLDGYVYKTRWVSGSLGQKLMASGRLASYSYF